MSGIRSLPSLLGALGGVLTVFVLLFWFIWLNVDNSLACRVKRT